MIEIEFENLVKNFKGSRRIFLSTFEKAIKIIGKPASSATGKIMLTLVNDKEIHALNREYRGVDKPTDVLSFSYFGELRFPGDDVIGEIIISVPTAKKQAIDHKKTLDEELRFLFLHGLLHVFGHDHIRKNERKTMFDLQDKIVGNKSWREISESEAEEEY